MPTLAAMAKTYYKHGMTSREKLLLEIEAFLASSGLSAAAFGIQAVRDPAIVYDIRKGKNPRLDTADRLRDFMAAWKPAKNPKRAASRAA